VENFNIDAQTLQDLNIFTGPPNSGPVFNIFKGTRTIGGRERMRTMMAAPSANLQLIKTRRDAIRYFYDHKITLDIRNEELDLIEFYLKSDGRKSKANLIDAVADFITRNSSNDYYIVTTGLKYLIRLARYLNNLIKEHQSEGSPEYISAILERIGEIIDQGMLGKAILLNETALKFYQVNQLDKAFRGTEKRNIHELLQFVYELDVFECVAYVASEKNFCFPQYENGEEMKVSMKGLFHPGIKNPVKNDVIFSKEENIVFLTGSNMAGKSSLLKSIGLAVYLAHLGFPVPATEMQTSIFNGLVSTINLPDDISDGLSHYYSEVKRVKQVAQMLINNERMFVIFDELFRGTNVKDAFDASFLIISELSNIKNSAFFISTHIVELAAELKKYDNITFKYLETFFQDHKPVFTYQLASGISKERLGMYIVLNEGIVEDIRKAAGQI